MHIDNNITEISNEASYLRRLFEDQRAAAAAAPFPSLEQRTDLLRRVGEMLDGFEDAFVSAIAADFGYRATFETRLSELLVARMALAQARKQLKKWMRPRRVGTHMLFLPGKGFVQPQPLGVVGVIAPWNFPLQLILCPMITALAAGNRVIAKPSELTPKFAKVFADACEQHFSLDEVAVVQGRVELAQVFTSLPFDHLVFTGSTSVGRKVAVAAAQNLTPVTLELGGKSPAILDESANLNTAVRRIVKGKLTNAGQICVSPDYLLVPSHLMDTVVPMLLEQAREMYPTLIDNPDTTAIISKGHFERLTGLLEDARAKGAVVQSAIDEPPSAIHRTLPFSVVTQVSLDMAVMEDEIFGPILPVVPVASHEDAMTYVRDRARPLALYWFGTDKDRRKDVLTKVHAGGVTLNDTLLHVVQDHLPFGGVGDSGMGNYHGRDGFERLSHMKGVFQQASTTATDILAAPFTPFKERMTKFTEWLGRR